MSLFDLLFLALFFSMAVTLVVVVWAAAQRQLDRAWRILRRLFVAAAVYMAIVVAVSMILPRRIVRVGDPECFDDLCVSIPGFRRIPEGYAVDVRLFSRARRVSQRENNLAVYLADSQGRRYDPETDKPAAPFNVLLGPGESVVVNRSFTVPAHATQVGAVITHEGGFPIGWFIIGYDTWFRKPPLIKLD